MFARLFLLTLVIVYGALAAETVNFQTDVRPVLSDACFHCHGPDPETRIFDLRLDTREGAFEVRANGTLLVPGDPEASLLYQRISAAEPARRMPPAHVHKDLTAEQIAKIRAWIEEGAEWEGHWAFAAPVRRELPVVKQEAWVRNPIDRFVLAKLEARGLAPAPEADRRTLARRLSLDLTGLPPAPEELEAFVRDESPDAYEKLIDRWMAKPAWGEHRARYWLDAARYADTHGLHIDNYREMWPYRDWVIESFNRNQPFDEFTVEQIAGDLLENPTREQLIATGFHRCNVTTNEGGVIDDEVAVMYDKDRVDTTSAVWLGLTVGCATCHDHKFDPIKQRDFYSLAAFFRNTTQKPRDGNIFNTPPVILVGTPEDEARYEELLEEEPRARGRLTRIRLRAAKTLRKRVKANRENPLDLPRFDDSEILTIRLDETPTARFGGAERELILSENITEVEGPTADEKALRIGEDGVIEVPGFAEFEADDAFSLSIRFWMPEKGGRGPLVSRADPDDRERGWYLEVSGGRPLFVMVGDRSEELGVISTKGYQARKGAWNHVAASYDGSRTRTGMRLFLNGRAVPTTTSGNGIHRVDGTIKTGSPLLLGARERKRDVSHFEQAAISELRILNRAIGEADAALLAAWSDLRRVNGKKIRGRDRAGKKAVATWYLTRENEAYREESRGLERNLLEQAAILRRTPVTHVQEEREDGEVFAHVLYRGMYDQPRERVEAGTPGVLPPMAEDLPRNRLGLAKWLVADEHPLTARVTVNRLWQQVFGTGIVETAEDFGSQGKAPTHPELLDWMAVEFRESGWDVKKFFRLMAMSATYRQSAAATPEKLEKDPRNRLLSRGPRFRMDGEMVRDYALAAGGLLRAKVGGPSVKPYQPTKIWETVAMEGSNTRFYTADNGEKLYRRSLYTFWKRSAPPPNMEIFNAPTREHSTVRRERTNTPLQALVTMNDPQFVEAARHLADHAYRAGADLDARLDYMTARLLARPLGSREREITRAAYRDYMRYYDSQPADGELLLRTGASPPPEGPTAELAALTMVANQFLNLDEALNK